MRLSFSHRAEQAEEGQRIATVLKHRFGFSTALLRQLKLLPDGILLDGERAFANQPVRAGQRITCLLPPEEASSNILPVEGPLTIVYEDEALLILEKPCGVAVHPSQGHFTDSLANFVAFEMQRRGEPFVFRAVNRLDRNTSGLMAVAKSGYIQTRLIEQLKTGQLHREYLAICQGRPLPPSGCISKPILDLPKTLKRVVDEHGAPAVTHYETLETRAGFSLLRLWLETGRTHQIRVHMASVGCPVAGDFLYGNELAALSGHALHSASLSLLHPLSGETLCFQSAMRPEMEAFWRSLPNA